MIDFLDDSFHLLNDSLPDGFVLDLNTNFIIIRYIDEEIRVTYHPDVQPQGYIEHLLDEIQIFVAMHTSAYWPVIGKMKLNYSIEMQNNTPNIIFSIRK